MSNYEEFRKKVQPIEWKNNETRLNQTNLNTMSESIKNIRDELVDSTGVTGLMPTVDNLKSFVQGDNITKTPTGEPINDLTTQVKNINRALFGGGDTDRIDKQDSTDAEKNYIGEDGLISKLYTYESTNAADLADLKKLNELTNVDTNGYITPAAWKTVRLGTQEKPFEKIYVKSNNSVVEVGAKLNESDSKNAELLNSITKTNQKVWGDDTPPTDGTTIAEKVNELSNKKADILSPVFEGVPEAPTPLDTSTSSSQIATTEFVHSVVRNELSAKANKATTLSGYGITDAYTKAQVDEMISSGGGGSVNPEDLEGYATEEWVENYVNENTGAIVYLNTKQNIGTTLELQDVYPIQADDTILKIISKNRMEYYPSYTAINGITLSPNDGKYLTVGGKPGGNVNNKTTLATIRMNENDNIFGKYTIKVDNNGVDSTNKKCYIMYGLYNSDNIAVVADTRLTTEPVTFDAKELNCTTLKIFVYLNANATTSFEGDNGQSFKIQVNYGDKALEYTDPVTDNTSYSNRKINVYSRNLFNSKHSSNANFNSVTALTDVLINGQSFKTIDRLGIYYFKGVMAKDNYIDYNYTADGAQAVLYTPLHKGDRFTLSYNVVSIIEGTASINNVQIFYGHTDYEEYEQVTDLTKDSNYIISGEGGICDISNLKYPYSFLELENIEENNDYAIYLSYDPALSRNWVERQLGDINSVLASIVNGGTN